MKTLFSRKKRLLPSFIIFGIALVYIYDWLTLMFHSKLSMRMRILMYVCEMFSISQLNY